MTTTSEPMPRPAPPASPSSAPAVDLGSRLEAAAALPLDERAAELVAIHEALAVQLRRTES
ncbi:hypothetical protein [Actinomyces sp. MRS3W]|uniref:hypothetical protein n=1 Tax=Actinomyces sp. MRS3W TaxID=2800796 RepID=UPI0028FD158C|nr:hypothetical protein [Actinomyces sp. MRS3W]MDU0347512.1 hypothetical protein [Actinomyces sp. MRS3W]